VASRLRVSDLLALGASCRGWREAVQAHALWAHAFARRWPALTLEAAACGARWRTEYSQRAAAVAGATFLVRCVRCVQRMRRVVHSTCRTRCVR
jgi:hypothetical protein